MTQRQADSTTERLFRLPALVALCLMVAGCGGSPGGAPPGGADTGATLGTGSANTPLLALNVFSAQLVSSRPFELGGRRYDLRRLMPNGITQWGTAATTAVAPPPGYTSVLPFVGSAIAIGAWPVLER